MSNKEIGKTIRKLRELKGFSQQSLSNEIGISQKQLSRIESEKISPNLELLNKIAKSLGVSINELFSFDESIVFNNYTTNQQGGEFKAYNNTAVEQIQKLYEKLLEEKDRRIALLEKALGEAEK